MCCWCPSCSNTSLLWREGSGHLDVISCPWKNNYHFREVCCLHVPRTLTGLPNPVERGSTYLKNVSNYFSCNAVWHPKGLESSRMLLCESQTTHNPEVITLVPSFLFKSMRENRHTYLRNFFFFQAEGGIPCTRRTKCHSKSHFGCSNVAGWFRKCIFRTEWVQDAAWPNF
jgi:hypothetical protein